MDSTERLYYEELLAANRELRDQIKELIDHHRALLAWQRILRRKNLLFNVLLRDAVSLADHDVPAATCITDWYTEPLPSNNKKPIPKSKLATYKK